MELTPEMVRAAEAQGCHFTPATTEQVARLTMQRRIFLIDGEPHVAMREKTGVMETHGAVARLIAGEPPETPPAEAASMQQAAAEDAQAALELAKQSTAGRGGAQVLRGRRNTRRPGGMSRGTATRGG